MTTFPAYAGVILCGMRRLIRGSTFPAYAGVILSSRTTRAMQATFPAYAGVILLIFFPLIDGLYLPRVCGGHPDLHRLRVFPDRPSPRMRGSSLCMEGCICERLTVPAYAGVIPGILRLLRPNLDLPRVCGGHPFKVAKRLRGSRPSPRMRGSSHSLVCQGCVRVTFPAYAGVIPMCVDRQMDWVDLPRVCGGHPMAGVLDQQMTEPSPRMRGSSRGALTGCSGRLTFPAYAGVIPKDSARRS